MVSGDPSGPAAGQPRNSDATAPKVPAVSRVAAAPPSSIGTPAPPAKTATTDRWQSTGSEPANCWQNNYHRPQAAWICGYQAVGEPCWTGPSPQGRCGCHDPCHPRDQDGVWVCARPAHRGGACSCGPTSDGQCGQRRPPCQPRRSWRSQRGRLSLAILSTLLGVGLMLWGSGRGPDVIAPGPLSSPHAQLLAHRGSDRCAACHPQAHQSASQWIQAAWGPSPPGRSQSDLCLDCHQRDMCRETAKFAHGLPPEQLQLKTREVQNRTDRQHASGPASLLAWLPGGSAAPSPTEALACSTCHREHHGKAADLTAMTSAQCQACHSQHFHSFEGDHPDFDNWPRVSNKGIRFDHRTHFFQHFAQADRPFDCAQCHQADASGNVQRLTHFQQACGDCHQSQIDLQMDRGWTFMQLPALDLPRLESAGLSVGQWPQALSHDFDGQLSPLSLWLLQADPAAVAALQTLGHDFDFLDLDPDDRQQLQAAQQVAWSVKRLLADLAHRGQEAIGQRLSIALQKPLDEQQLAALMHGFSPTLFQDSARRWFPNLSGEIDLQEASPRSEFQTAQVVDNRRLVLPPAVLARLRQPHVAQDQATQELLAENPLADRVETTARKANLRTAAPALPQNIGPAQSTQSSAQTSAQSPAQSVGSHTAAEDPDLLAVNPLANRVPDPNDSVDSDGVLIAPAADVSTANRSRSAGADPSENPSGRTVSPTVPESLDDRDPPRGMAADWLPTARPVGWVRDDRRFAIAYHGAGHADPWLSAWLELLAQHATAIDPGLGESLIRQAGTAHDPGSCLQCHSQPASTGRVDSQGEAPLPQLNLNWRGDYRDPHVKSWTRFDHRPHTLLPALADCQSCHQLRELSSIGADSGKPTGTGQTIGCCSDFHAIRKAHCASCHHAQGSSNRCTTCHNYHVGSSSLSGSRP